jgi:peroxiredoxin
VADGNCAYTQALDMTKDATGSRMGLRSKRYAAIIENGEVKEMLIDEKGLGNSSAENVLSKL